VLSRLFIQVCWINFYKPGDIRFASVLSGNFAVYREWFQFWFNFLVAQVWQPNETVMTMFGNNSRQGQSRAGFTAYPAFYFVKNGT
jgi:hypothetical protein